MIFDGRPIDDITDQEILALVDQHVAERRHLEFKATFTTRDDEDRLEILLDVASRANAGGGYLFVGIRDDGRGRAQRWDNPGDTAAVAKSIRASCLDHISDRIDGLEVGERVVDGNPLVIVRVPVSARIPHMVTFQRRTAFHSRYDDGKREMSLAEIREAFTADETMRRLSSIERALQQR